MSKSSSNLTERQTTTLAVQTGEPPWPVTHDMYPVYKRRRQRTRRFTLKVPKTSTFGRNRKYRPTCCREEGEMKLGTDLTLKLRLSRLSVNKKLSYRKQIARQLRTESNSSKFYWNDLQRSLKLIGDVTIR